MKKIRKYRGRKTGHGAKKKHRGHGSKGGRGRAGLGESKRGWKEKYEPDHFGKPSLKSFKNDLKVINLDQISSLIEKNNLKCLELKDYKVLGRGNLNHKITIRANSFSSSAIQKIESAGGKVELIGKVKIKNPEGSKSE